MSHKFSGCCDKPLTQCHCHCKRFDHDLNLWLSTYDTEMMLAVEEQTAKKLKMVERAMNEALKELQSIETRTEPNQQLVQEKSAQCFKKKHYHTSGKWENYSCIGKNAGSIVGSGIGTSTGTTNYGTTGEIVDERVRNADAVLIGAGAGIGRTNSYKSTDGIGSDSARVENTIGVGKASSRTNITHAIGHGTTGDISHTGYQIGKGIGRSIGTDGAAVENLKLDTNKVDYLDPNILGNILGKLKNSQMINDDELNHLVKFLPTVLNADSKIVGPLLELLKARGFLTNDIINYLRKLLEHSGNKEALAGMKNQFDKLFAVFEKCDTTDRDNSERDFGESAKNVPSKAQQPRKSKIERKRVLKGYKRSVENTQSIRTFRSKKSKSNLKKFFSKKKVSLKSKLLNENSNSHLQDNESNEEPASINSALKKRFCHERSKVSHVALPIRKLHSSTMIESQQCGLVEGCYFKPWPIDINFTTGKQKFYRLSTSQRSSLPYGLETLPIMNLKPESAGITCPTLETHLRSNKNKAVVPQSYYTKRRLHKPSLTTVKSTIIVRLPSFMYRKKKEMKMH